MIHLNSVASATSSLHYVGRGCTHARSRVRRSVKRVLNRAVRRSAREYISEFDGEEVESSFDSRKKVYRLVVTLQVLENYGVHAWTPMSGARCEQYWKAKGGREIIVDLAADMVYSPKLVYQFVEDIVQREARCDLYYQEYLLRYDVLGPGELSYEERIDASVK